MKKSIITIVKSIWISLIVFFSCYYLFKNYEQILSVGRIIPLGNILTMFVMILIGKLLLVVTMRFSLKIVSADLGFKKTFIIYNLSQLGKYIPGFIWQYIGKIGYYRKEGLTARQIKQAILSEIAIDQSGAIAIGLLIFTLPIGTEIFSLALTNRFYIITVTVLMVISIIILVVKRKEIGSMFLLIISKPFDLLIAVTSLIILWSALGMSLFVVIEPFLITNPSPLYVISLYCIAFFLGFIFPFAPAGLGIREAILTLGLSAFMATDNALIISGLNRICYIIVEIVLVLLYYSMKVFRPIKK